MWRALLLFVIISPAWALSEARLINLSSTAQTAIFNLGSVDGMVEGDYAVIVKQLRHIDGPDLRLVPVAKGKNIKISTNSSVWVLYHIYDEELLVKKDPYLILSETTMLQGRRDPRLGRLTVVDNKSKYVTAAKNALTDDGDRLAKLKEKYRKTSPVSNHDKEFRSDADFDLVDLEKWEKQGVIRNRSALVKSPNNADFKRNLRLSTFEKLVTGYLKKVNDPDFNYAVFYDQTMRDEYSNEFTKKPGFENEYTTFVKNESIKNTADAKIYRSMLERGETWSDDFSDEELHIVLNDVSILQEKERRVFALSKPTTYSLSMDFGQFLNDSQTDKDTRYRRDNPFSLDLHFEATPFVKPPVLEKFTIDGSVRMSRSAFEAEDLNASINEYSIAVGANWYPVHAPYAVQAPVFFLGTYLRNGFADVAVPSANESGKYTVMTLPGLRVGMKYNLRNHVGLRIVASMETLKLEQYEADKDDAILPDRTNVVQANIGFGLGYSF